MAIRDYPEYKSKYKNYKIVENTSDFVDYILDKNRGKDHVLLACDTETYYDEETGGISRFINGVPNNTPFCVTMYDGEFGYYISRDIPKLARLFNDPRYYMIFHNHKYDRHMLANIGIDLDINRLQDTMIMIHLIDEEFECRTADGTMKKSKKLKDLAYHFLNGDAHELENLVAEYRDIKAAHLRAEGKSTKKDEVSYKEIEELNPELMKDYACADVEFTYNLYFKFLPEIKRQDLAKAYRIDMNASDAVFKMERRGVAIDKDYYEKLYDQYGEDIKEILGRFPADINIDSNNDVVKMFERLGVVWEWKTQKKENRVDSKVLETLKKFNSNEQIVKYATDILEYRDLTKTRDTFVKNMLDYCQADGRVHPDFNVCPNDYDTGSTRTGRLSSSNPRLLGLHAVMCG